MKKTISMFLAISMMLILVACGSSEQQSTDPENSAVSSSDITAGSSDGEASEQISFEELTVVDNDQCTIKITEIDDDNILGYTLKVYLENKSSDSTYMFSVTGASINGVQTDPLFAVEVAAGKKSNSEITFYDDDLSSDVIGNYTDIELSFNVYDSSDWSADVVAVAEETVHVYPYGEDKAVTYVRESKDTDTVLVDNDNVSVIVTGYDKDGFWGYTVNLYIVNKTDSGLTYSVDEASVNGYMSDPLWATLVNAGKVKFDSISWFDSDLESNGITEVEEIEMKLKIYYSDDWYADDVYNEVVTLTP